MKRHQMLLVGAALLSGAQTQGPAVSAATTLYTATASAWTDLGPGPLQVEVGPTPCAFAFADTLPGANDPGFPITQTAGGAPVPLQTTSHVFAKALGGSGAACLALVAPLASAGIAPAAPAFVTSAGSSGTDYSANPPAVPSAGGVLLQTIPATPTRSYVEVQNQAATQVQVVRDDGAGNNVTSILLAPGASAGTQGGGWSSATFKGRVRIYGAAGAQVAAYQD